MNLAVDTDALIKLTKGSSKELVASRFRLLVPPEVRRESVVEGKAAGHADAVRIEENLRKGLLRSRRPRRSPRAETLVRDLRLRGGEADAVRLFYAGGVDGILSDDRRFLDLLEGIGISYATPSSLLVALVRSGDVSKREGLEHLDRLSRFIGREEYVEARMALEAA